ncbi:MAG: hypothetical protein C0606_00010 [Hyphomicrobiales bacterium]|nr:MAG: hypothetical protein C0606_00010 [Hyphomicrobiales bacterium]
MTAVGWPKRSVRVLALVAAIAGFGSVPASAGSDPSFVTNQAYVEEVTRDTELAVDDIDAMFAYVLTNLAPEVFVYPTENYHYFSFVHDGTDYTGNVRLSVVDRDEGFVHFNFYKTFTRWRRDLDYRYKRYGPDDGVKIVKKGDFVYSVTFRDIERTFHLNDKLAREMPEGLLGAEESYIGPIFDESGIRFFLVYDRPAKLFHYILDETDPVADELYRSEYTDDILIGRRTGFAFYEDKNVDRRILIGVFEENSNTNSYLDGPFDQLPDNYVQGEALRDALIDMDPTMKGEIDRFGFWSNDARFMIGPYLYYKEEADLLVFDDCARSEEMQGEFYYRCFYVEQPDEGADAAEVAEGEGTGDDKATPEAAEKAAAPTAPAEADAAKPEPEAEGVAEPADDAVDTPAPTSDEAGTPDDSAKSDAASKSDETSAARQTKPEPAAQPQ